MLDSKPERHLSKCRRSTYECRPLLHLSPLQMSWRHLLQAVYFRNCYKTGGWESERFLALRSVKSGFSEQICFPIFDEILSFYNSL